MAEERQINRQQSKAMMLLKVNCKMDINMKPSIASLKEEYNVHYENLPRSPEDLEIIGLSSTMYGLEPSTMLLLDIIVSKYCQYSVAIMSTICRRDS